MKRELAFALEAQSQLSNLLGGTRSGKAIHSPLLNLLDRSSYSAKKRRHNGVPLYEVNSLVHPTEEPDLKSNVRNGVCENAENVKTKSYFLNEELVKDAVCEVEKLKKSEGTKSSFLNEELVKDADREVEKLKKSEGAETLTLHHPASNLANNLCAVKNETEGDRYVTVESRKIRSTEHVAEQERSSNLATTVGEESMNSEMALLLTLEELKENKERISGNEDGALGTATVTYGIKQGTAGSKKAESAKMEKSNRRFTRSALKSQKGGGEIFSLMAAGSGEAVQNIAVENAAVSTSVMEKPVRRFTRSALKSKEGGNEVFSLRTVASGDTGRTDRNTVCLSASVAPRNQLKLKMSKKIVLNRIPSTLRQLLQTGLLEGYEVTYKCAKNATELLRGVIKNIGVLCLCSLCKGQTVISPSKFELHACNSYRRAVEYIHLDNGKSLLEVLNSCKGTRLDALEATIQNAIGVLPISSHWTTASAPELKHSQEMTSTHVTQSIHATKSICKSCKGPLPAGQAAEVGSVCSSCLTSKTLQTSLTKVDNRSAWLQKTKQREVLKESKVLADSSSQKKSQWKITKKDQRLHRIVFEEGGLPDGTELGYYGHGKKLLEGYKRGFGIFCLCCSTEVSPSQFEAHAGRAKRKKPYNYIYTSNGVSLHEFAVSLLKDREHSSKDNDDLCIICANGGDLVLCDGCPRAFHEECASLSCIPVGKWYCKYCENMFMRERYLAHNANAVAAGRVSGVDPIEQITTRCIRIVGNLEPDVTTCVLCSGRDFREGVLNTHTIILCDQCEKEYHVGCLKMHDMADLNKLPEGKWFCCTECSWIHSTLQNMLVSGAGKLDDFLLTHIKRKDEDKILDANPGFDVSWRLLNGNTALPETRSLLSQAVSIFHERFDPIIDPTTGNDLIPPMVYGRNMGGYEFTGMYCAVLLVNSSVVSAGILRVYGQEFAELPLVATSSCHQGKGYFQTLFSCIGKLLESLKVRRIVLPAADEAESIWITKFGFEKVSLSQLRDYKRGNSQMMLFQGTSLLHKMNQP